ncbi:hypothetical protein ACFV9E_30675 [Streptomyces sp. NPDC059835]|uniref:hypothetical protein n=1 Tax=Streptomyces sp. NPDC059835 TaxID=3346967 RepID=UPI0036483F18
MALLQERKNMSDQARNIESSSVAIPVEVTVILPEIAIDETRVAELTKDWPAHLREEWPDEMLLEMAEDVREDLSEDELTELRALSLEGGRSE